MFFRKNNKGPAVILQYISSEEEAPNQYIPYGNIEAAKTAVTDYFDNGGDPDYLGIFVDREKGEWYAHELQTITKKMADVSVPVYAIFPGVLKLALS